MCKVILTENNFHEFLLDIMGVAKLPETKEDIETRFRKLAGMDKYTKENN